MTPVLFDDTTTDFNTRGLGALTETTYANVKEVANGSFELELDYPTFGTRANLIEQSMIIVAKPNDQDDPHAFRIYEVDKDAILKSLHIVAASITSDENGNNLDSFPAQLASGTSTMARIKTSLDVPSRFTYYSDITDQKLTPDWTNKNPTDALLGATDSFIATYGGELKRENDKISMLQRRGRNSAATIRYRKNLSGLTVTSSMAGVVTRILPIAKLPKQDGQEEAVQVSGTPVDSPLFKKYPIPLIRVVDFTDDKNILTVEDLNNKAKTWFSENKGVDEPTLTIKLDILSLQDSADYTAQFKRFETIGLFDTVSVYYKPLGINISAKVSQLDYNPLTETNQTITLGTADTSYSYSVVNTIKDKLNQVDYTINQIWASADGKNSVSQGGAEPHNPKTGDLWYKPDGEFIEMLQWDGGAWVTIINTGDLKVVADQLSDLKNDMVVTSAAASAAAIAGSNAQVAANSVAAAVVESDKEIAAAKSAASSAVDQASQANVNAGFANSQVSLAKQDAANAVTQASTAYNAATSAVSNAQSALSAATSATATTKALSSTVDDINGTIKNLATTETVNKLTGTVSSAQALAQLAADGLEIKADKTTVDTLKGSVEKNTASIKTNADSISAKVTASDVTGMLGNYATQSWSQSQLSIAKNGITESVQNMTSDMATQTWTQGKLDLTADGLTSQISSVKTDLNNLNVGGRNYFLNSERFTITPPGADNWDWTGLKISSDFLQNTDRLKNNNIKISFDLTAKKALAADFSGYMYFRNSPWYAKPFIYPKGTTAKQHYELIYTIADPDYTVADMFIRFQAKDTAAYPFTLEHAKLEVGTLFTDWSPAPEDMATAVQFTSLEETLKGVQITANNAVTQSQYTQLADQITSVIGDLDNLIIGGDFEDQRDYLGKQSPYWSGTNAVADNIDKNQDTNKSNTVLQINGLVSGNNDVTSKNLVAIRQAEYNMSLKTKWHNPDQLGSIIIYAFEYDANKNLIAHPSIVVDGSPHGWRVITTTYKPSSSAVKYMALDVTYNGAKSTLPVWIDDIHLGLATATQSQITQLQNDINLRVKTGVLINQINVSTEGILIDGAKTHITNTTTIDTGVIKSANIQDAAITTAKIGSLAVNTAQIADGAITNAKIGNASITTAKIGDAQISSAKIISISADKITAGTLDAAKVNVVNLNASNITTGTISGANLSINLTTGEILFQRGAIRSTNGNLNIDIDNGNMEVVNSVGSGFRFQNGGLYLTDKSWSWPTPTYGSITYSPSLFSNTYGIAIKGATGASLSSNNYDDASLMWQHQPASGAAVSLMRNDALLNARERAAVEGGNLYNETVYQIPSRATIVVGGNNGDGEGSTDQYGDYHLQNPTGVGSDVYIKGTHITLQGGDQNGLSDLNLGNDGKGFISSTTIYNRTYSSGDHVVITGWGMLGRLTSARKYKIADQVATGIVTKAQRALAISPAEWYDKAEIESIADAKTNGTEAPGEAKIEKHYGFIADDFDAAGLTEVVNYHNGEVDSLSYDHISMYHHVILQNHEKEIEELKQTIEELKGIINK